MAKTKGQGTTHSEEIQRQLDKDLGGKYTGESPDEAPLSGPWRNTSRDSEYLKPKK